MNAIDLLKQQHDEVEDLFEQLEDASSDGQKLALFQQLADNLAAHAAIEEKIFYPAAYAKQTEDLLREAVEEHLGVKRIIADLLALAPDDETFDAKIKVLKEQVEHHVEEEEGELFKAARKELGATELKRLGAEMEQLFDSLVEKSPSAEVPAQTDEAAPLP